MMNPPDHTSSDGPIVSAFGEPLLVEDVLLLLFQPDSGSIAGENTLFYVLGGAVLGDLALAERVEVRRAGPLTRHVHALSGEPVADDLLASAWAYILEKPRGIQTVLAAIGPALRNPVIDRLVERGDLTREKGKAFGLFPTEKLALGSDRRASLVAQIRSALIDGDTPAPRIAAAIALISASKTLPQFHGEIPWSSDVYTRSKAIERGDWGAAAAADAVTRTMIAVTGNAAIAATVLPRV
ncbi:GPP34 family phosphoprotein [Arthrobacter sp. ATA002]|uniref:GOLPH3/VPS74 family protein n=1 Tax=Arthrobacter sp. ATA002 TaxID=2991715 RepID=UPI0022A67C3E|nr:GPP34 family phosphoprotein [Arthrobacter sp. ATA002]WAP52217.1 GPP34 family phosphoprotein [Arthrobacter sp. ATA002]